MGWLLIGLIVAAVFLILLEWWSRAEIGSAKRALFWAAIIACIAVCAILALTGKVLAAVIPVAMTAWKFRGIGRAAGQAGSPRPKPRETGMSRKEALEVLGLREGASGDEINAAYRRLMAINHPDKGGSDWMAAKLNEARRILIGD